MLPVRVAARLPRHGLQSERRANRDGSCAGDCSPLVRHRGHRTAGLAALACRGGTRDFVHGRWRHPVWVLAVAQAICLALGVATRQAHIAGGHEHCGEDDDAQDEADLIEVGQRHDPYPLARAGQVHGIDSKCGRCRGSGLDFERLLEHLTAGRLMACGERQTARGVGHGVRSTSNSGRGPHPSEVLTRARGHYRSASSAS
jgi:hypothetical protein